MLENANKHSVLHFHEIGSVDAHVVAAAAVVSLKENNNNIGDIRPHTALQL